MSEKRYWNGLMDMNVSQITPDIAKLSFLEVAE